MKIINNLSKSIFLVLLISACVFGYGESDDEGHPTYTERTALLAANLARINPYKFSKNFMASFDNYTFSDISNIYTYNNIMVPQKPFYYNDDLNRLANAYLDMLLETPNCDYTGLQLCNGTQASEYIFKFYPYTTKYYMGYLLINNKNSVTPGYGSMMEIICDRKTSLSGCSADNTTINTARSLLVNYIYTQFGSASVLIDGTTYIVAFWAGDAPVDYGSTETAVSIASHIWKSPSTVDFYLDFYRSYDYPIDVQLIFRGFNRTLFQDITPDSQYSTRAPHAVYKNTISSDVEECDTYHFEIKTYSGYTLRYPNSGYLTLSYENSTCKAWATSEQGFTSSSSTLTVSLLFSVLILLFSILF